MVVYIIEQVCNIIDIKANVNNKERMVECYTNIILITIIDFL